ncbi:sensor histidine kinase [Paenibacillus gorillae]|uniref:sensor histidine kinase n=1 Tax=Paenibacillus gorillae TaxID=1243662 RepID=UPI001EE19577|nr:HAMP domain-containing sensor histidine kinase [Paenibacillus gorillae]
MKDRIALRMVWQTLMHMAISIALGCISIIFLVAGSEILTRGSGLRSLILRVANILGIQETMYVAGIILILAFFCFFQWRSYRNLERIGQSVRYISEGNFDDVIRVAPRSTFSNLAKDMNVLVERLKNSLDDERRAEQTKNELITNVSHDLRTPLTSVLGYLGLVEQDRYRDEVELRHYVQIAYEKSQRLHVLINDLFEYTRMRHDAIPLQQVTMSLKEMLGQLLVQFLPELQQAEMEGKLYGDDKEILISGDPGKLVRVFENLLSNAIAYGKEGKRLEIRLRKEARWAFVEVTNYGETISAADLPYLFDRFYRVDKSRTEKSGGSGLGLAIAKGIVEKHGGEISVTSDSAVTTFRVRLPALD